MISTETLDQIVYIFGLNQNNYTLESTQQFIYKGRLVAINDKLPKDNDPELLKLNIMFCRDCLKGNQRKYDKALLNENYELVQEIRSENNSLVKIILDCTKKLAKQKDEPFTKQDKERLKVSLSIEFGLPTKFEEADTKEWSQEETDFLLTILSTDHQVVVDILNSKFHNERTLRSVKLKMEKLERKGYEMPKRTKKWTQEELDFLIQNYGLSSGQLEIEMKNAGFDRNRRVIWQKKKWLKDKGLV